MSPVTRTPIGPVWWREICTGYLRSLARKGRRPNTLRSYSSELRVFGKWLELAGIRTSDDLTGRHIEAFQDGRGDVVKPRTQQVAAAAIAAALRWAAAQEPSLCAPSLYLRVTVPRVNRPHPRPFPQADLAQVLAALAPRADASLVQLRTRALFWVILSSGARITEALSLERDQLRDRTAMVIQKGGGEKLLVINEVAEEAVRGYLAARNDSYRSMFVGHEPERPGPLTWELVQGQWNRLCKQLGIARFTTHRIRHSCATEMLRRNINPIVIAHHLGHRGLGSIEGYAEVGLELRRQALTAFDVMSAGLEALAAN